MEKNIDSERRYLLVSKILKEVNSQKEKCLWMSFCDNDKPKGQQFLGVIIMRSCGIAMALHTSHSLGINPGGEVMSCEIDGSKIKPEYFNRLLSKEEAENLL